MTAPELRVVTFNIRYDNPRDGRHRWALRRQLLARHLHGQPWDVLGLQEVLVGQRTYLERQWSDTRWYGVGRADGFEAGEQAPLVVRGERWRVEDWQSRWLSERPDQVGSRGWDAKIPRVATVVRLRAAEGPEVRVANTHFDHAGPTAREQSAALVASWVAAEPSAAWLVMGDLNCTPDSAPLSVLHAAGLRSVLADSAGGTEHAWTGRTDRRRIDHILISAGLEVVAAATDYARPFGTLLSDHWPVRATLQLRA